MGRFGSVLEGVFNVLRLLLLDEGTTVHRIQLGGAFRATAERNASDVHESTYR